MAPQSVRRISADEAVNILGLASPAGLVKYIESGDLTLYKSDGATGFSYDQVQTLNERRQAEAASPIPPLDRPFIDLVNDYIEAHRLQGKMEEAEISDHDGAVRRLANYLTENEITEPTRDDIVAYRDSLFDDLKANRLPGFATINTVGDAMIIIRNFFGWAEALKLYPNVAKDVGLYDRDVNGLPMKDANGWPKKPDPEKPPKKQILSLF